MRWGTATFGVIGALATVVLAADKPADKPPVAETAVEVRLPADLPMAKASVLVYAVPAGDGWPTVQAECKRDREASVTASLPPGRYVAEVGAVAGDGVALLRTPPFAVPGTRAVTFATQRQACSATVADRPARVEQVAVRRFGNGEVRWTATPKAAAAPTVVTSPGAAYVTSCVAEQDPVVMAVWDPSAKLTGSTLRFTDAAATHGLTFGVRPDTPATSGWQVTLQFPDAKVVIDRPTRQTRFVTNRDRALLSYALETDAGATLATHWSDCPIGAASHVEVGGPLTASLFADFVSEERDTGWRPELITRLDLADPAGRLVDQGKSKFGLDVDLFAVDKDGHRQPLADNKPSSKGFAAKSVVATYRYQFGPRGSAGTAVGQGLVRVKSAHFSIPTPPAWTFRADHFLNMLEAVRVITRQDTGRPGPVSCRVDWRLNGTSAKSIVASPGGGGRDIWMSFPWWTYDGSWDPFVEPWFGNKDPYVCHEMLHTFGYNHGDEMSHLEWKGEDLYRTFRWKTVDRGTSAVWGEGGK